MLFARNRGHCAQIYKPWQCLECGMWCSLCSFPQAPPLLFFFSVHAIPFMLYSCWPSDLHVRTHTHTYLHLAQKLDLALETGYIITSQFNRLFDRVFVLHCGLLKCRSVVAKVIVLLRGRTVRCIHWILRAVAALCYFDQCLHVGVLCGQPVDVMESVTAAWDHCMWMYYLALREYINLSRSTMLHFSTLFT